MPEDYLPPRPTGIQSASQREQLPLIVTGSTGSSVEQSASTPHTTPTVSSGRGRRATTVAAVLLTLGGMAWIGSSSLVSARSETAETQVVDGDPAARELGIVERADGYWDQQFIDAWGAEGTIFIDSEKFGLIWPQGTWEVGPAAYPVGTVSEHRDGTRVWALGLLPKGTKTVTIVEADALRATKKATNMTRNHAEVFKTRYPDYDLVLVEYDVPVDYEGPVVKRVVPHR